MAEARPWLRWYGDVPATLDYPDVTLYEAVMQTARRLPAAPAFEFLGSTATYGELGQAIDRLAGALAALGLGAGDRITISLPTAPQGVIAVYAASKLGAVPAMIHPLSTPEEIERYLNLSRSRFALTLDAFYERFAAARDRTSLETLVLTRVSDYLPGWKRPLYWLARGRKVPRVPAGAPVRWWSDLMRAEHGEVPAAGADPDELAVILYSGGTTGTPKGIMLSHRNLVSEGMEVAAWVRLREDDAVLVVLPIFHGFGLGALVNASLMRGAKVILVPRFDARALAKLIGDARPTVIAGVPTLYEALAGELEKRPADLSSLRAAFSGADTLQPALKQRFERLVAEHGGRATLLEGYGLTEAVSAIMLTPLHEPRESTIGVPFPDMLAAICRVDGEDEVSAGEEGEICLSGPAVMLGYLDDPEATAAALRRHRDGRVWLHTGDLGRMGADGFFSFSCRLKRMIKSSGYNVYPTQVEAALSEHPAVAQTCVIGVPDAAQGERVKAFVVPGPSLQGTPELAEELIAHCRERLIKWSCPREVEFRSKLPTTRLGKVDYVALMREDAEARAGEPRGA